MSLSNAPWLDGLDGTSTWKPAQAQQLNRPNSTTHDASSLIKSTRSSRRSNSGNSIHTMKKARSPLAPLNRNEHSSINRKDDSMLSDGSVMLKGTVQQRSKSSSPGKKEASLEWRKRLLNGKLAYGDQTDLFGPSGLENIFAGSQAPQSEKIIPKSKLSWLPKSDAAFPSSPPPWPILNNGLVEERPVEREVSRAAAEDNDDSALSNPFDLDASVSVAGEESYAGQAVDIPQAHGRMVSGPTILEQEDFSPVILSKHTTISGSFDYVPIDTSTSKVNAPANFVLTRASSSAGSITTSTTKHSAGADRLSRLLEVSVFTDGPSSAQQDLSLSENLPTGTPEPLGSHIQIKRGGYSTLGSFRHRPLSAEPTNLSDVLPEDTSFALPPAPSPPQHRDASSADKGSSSPLKLFGQHDTYTNKHLLRRLSEYNGELDDISIAEEAPPQRQTSFGQGELDSHIFDADVDLTTPAKIAVQPTCDSDGSPASDIAVPGSRLPRAFQTQTEHSHINLERWRESSIEMKPRLPSKAEQTPYPKNALTEAEHKPDTSPSRKHGIKAQSEHKRPPSSPGKHSTPKRRRTLHASELVEAARSRAREASNVLHHEVVGKPFGGPAAVKINAKTEENRPSNPTPSGQSHDFAILPDDIREATDDFLAHEDRSIVDDVLEQVEQSLSEIDPDTFRARAEVVAGEVARYTVKISKTAENAGDGERKRSVTTQDFFREAECVMEYIRARAAKKPSLLASVNESGNFEEQDREDSSLKLPKGHNSSEEYMRVSREPSWADRPRSRWREPEQLRMQRDAFDMTRVASQLRKWQEPDALEEQDVFLAETSEQEVVAEVDEPHSSSEIVFDQRANIRITGPSSEYAQQISGGDEAQPESQHSTQSSTDTTKRSENVGTLAPDAVAHLIGHEVGGMTFDREKQQWVRLRSPEHRATRNGLLDVHASHITSEDDPFREISDLAVDEGLERRRISSPAKFPPAQPVQADPVAKQQAFSGSSVNKLQQLSVSTTVLQTPRDQQQSLPSQSSDGLNNLTSTQPTSFDGASVTTQRPLFAADSRVMHVINEAEASIDAGRIVHAALDTEIDGKHTSTSVPGDDLLSRLREDTIVDEQGDISDIHSSRLRPQLASPIATLNVAPFLLQSPIRPTPQLEATILEHRDVSEVSFVAPLPGDRLVSVSLSVSKPAVQQQVGHVYDPESSPYRYQSSLILSDLPDFTVHQEDAEQVSEKALAQRFAKYAAIEVKDRFASATKELVKALTDAYPEETYWEEIHDIRMRNQALTTLVGLDTFCDATRSLDVSMNRLTHLHGMPATVRSLIASRNQLSNLTSFSHLGNLQYVNISGNTLKSLEAFSGCVHLRELIADDNQITLLAGVAGLDLLKLRCRRNKLGRVAFHKDNMRCLTDLDLGESDVKEVVGLEHLGSLTSLYLSGSNLEHGLQLGSEMPLLEKLELRGCKLSSLDVTRMPKLRILDLDDNSLGHVDGLDCLANLEVLSLRRQQLSPGKFVDVFTKSLEAHTVNLSGNKMSKLYIGKDQLSLKHLELASVGLLDLPTDFGLRMPNIRTLNLNFNCLKDLRPLLHIHGLQDLQVSGNRLARLRRTAAVLKNLPCLKHLGMRDNLLSQGFYASIAVPTKQHSTALMVREVADHDQDEDELRIDLQKRLYNLPRREKDSDVDHAERMDDDIRLKRRVYDILMAHSCQSLQYLDGFAFVKAIALKKDPVWHRLIELGVVRKAVR